MGSPMHLPAGDDIDRGKFLTQHRGLGGAVLGVGHRRHRQLSHRNQPIQRLVPVGHAVGAHDRCCKFGIFHQFTLPQPERRASPYHAASNRQLQSVRHEMAVHRGSATKPMGQPSEIQLFLGVGFADSTDFSEVHMAGVGAARVATMSWAARMSTPRDRTSKRLICPDRQIPDSYIAGRPAARSDQRLTDGSQETIATLGATPSLHLYSLDHLVGAREQPNRPTLRPNVRVGSTHSGSRSCPQLYVKSA